MQLGGDVNIWCPNFSLAEGVGAPLRLNYSSSTYIQDAHLIFASQNQYPLYSVYLPGQTNAIRNLKKKNLMHWRINGFQKLVGSHHLAYFNCCFLKIGGKVSIWFGGIFGQIQLKHAYFYSDIFDAV